MEVKDISILKNYLKNKQLKIQEEILNSSLFGFCIASLIVPLLIYIFSLFLKGDDLSGAVGFLILIINFIAYLIVQNEKDKIKINEESINLELEEIKNFLKKRK